MNQQVATEEKKIIEKESVALKEQKIMGCQKIQQSDQVQSIIVNENRNQEEQDKAVLPLIPKFKEIKVDQDMEPRQQVATSNQNQSRQPHNYKQKKQELQNFQSYEKMFQESYEKKSQSFKETSLQKSDPSSKLNTQNTMDSQQLESNNFTYKKKQQQQKKKSNIYERRDIKEMGVSVNPGIIQNAIKKAQPYNNRNQKKQVVILQQQQQSQQDSQGYQKKILNPMEIRSITPNIEIEPLSGNNNQNTCRNSNNYQKNQRQYQQIHTFSSPVLSHQNSTQFAQIFVNQFIDFNMMLQNQQHQQQFMGIGQQIPFDQNYFQPMMLGQGYYQQNFNQSMGFQNVSHLSQEKYEQMKSYQEREECFFVKFDQEIFKLQNKLKLKLQLTETERYSAFKCIEYYVKDTYQEFPNVRIQMYGSMATGLAIDSSDMDVLVSGIFSNQQHIDRQVLIDQMQKLHQKLDNLYCIENNQIIETASVPVIKIVLDLQKIRNKDTSIGNSIQIEEDMRYLKVDITFNDHQNDQGYGYSQAQPMHMGIKCCHFIKQKLNEYPNLEALTLVLKKFLALKNLNSPFLGGLSSYGLILMIIAFINSNFPQMYGPKGISSSRILIHFLLFYGNLFDPNTSLINEYIQITPHLNFQSILIILDPLNPSNNIGKSTYNFSKIKQEFQQGYEKIQASFNQFTNPQNQNSNDETYQVTESMWKQKLNILNQIIFDEKNEDTI